MSILFYLNFYTQKTKNSDIEVQSFGHNSETNRDIKNRNSNLSSPMNYEVNGIKMTLNLLDLDQLDQVLSSLKILSKLAQWFVQYIRKKRA